MMGMACSTVPPRSMSCSAARGPPARPTRATCSTAAAPDPSRERLTTTTEPSAIMLHQPRALVRPSPRVPPPDGPRRATTTRTHGPQRTKHATAEERPTKEHHQLTQEATDGGARRAGDRAKDGGSKGGGQGLREESARGRRRHGGPVEGGCVRGYVICGVFKTQLLSIAVRHP